MYQIFKPPSTKLRRCPCWLTLCVLAFATGTTWAHQTSTSSVASHRESLNPIETFLKNAGGKGRDLRPTARLFYLERSQIDRVQVAYVIDNSSGMSSALPMLTKLIPTLLEDKIDPAMLQRTIVYRRADGQLKAQPFSTSSEDLAEWMRDVAANAKPAKSALWGDVRRTIMELPWDNTPWDNTPWDDNKEASNTLRWVIVCGSSSTEPPNAEEARTLAREARVKNTSIISLLFNSSTPHSPDSLRTVKNSLAQLASSTAGLFVDLDSPSSRDAMEWKSTSIEIPSDNRLDEDSLSVTVTGTEQAKNTINVMKRLLRRIPLVVADSSEPAKYQVKIRQSDFRGRVEIAASLWHHDQRLASAAARLNSRNEHEIQEVAGRCMRDLLTSTAAGSKRDPQHADLNKRIVDHLDRTKELRSMIASHPRARNEIMAALDLLRQSNMEDAKTLPETIRRARAHLNNADFYDRGNAFALLLMAHGQFNLAQAANEIGDQNRQQNYSRAYFRYLGGAYEAARRSLHKNSPIRLLIEAEYYLSEFKFEEAIAKCEAITEHPMRATADIELIARWNLCWLYAGDWGVASQAEELIDATKSQRQMQTILDDWPNSHEATFFRREIGKESDAMQFTLPIGENEFATWLTASISR